MYNWKELLDYINGEIAGMSFERQPAELYAPIRYVLSMGGKRIRPVLMLMAYNLYKEKVEVIGSQAMAIEIYHNYTLLHDDLMDRADMRRGMATVHKKWDENAAILSGELHAGHGLPLHAAGLSSGTIGKRYGIVYRKLPLK